jgi:hypothetical protein
LQENTEKVLEEGNLGNDFKPIEIVIISARETSVTNSLGIRTSRLVIGKEYAMQSVEKARSKKEFV